MLSTSLVYLVATIWEGVREHGTIDASVRDSVLAGGGVSVDVDVRVLAAILEDGVSVPVGLGVSVRKVKAAAAWRDGVGRLSRHAAHGAGVERGLVLNNRSNLDLDRGNNLDWLDDIDLLNGWLDFVNGSVDLFDDRE